MVHFLYTFVFYWVGTLRILLNALDCMTGSTFGAIWIKGDAPKIENKPFPHFDLFLIICLLSGTSKAENNSQGIIARTAKS